ncbi:stage V sporulation protein B [Pelotomaculum propionicicum]|uniref:stage V sporulation protein B n=1 Tax=Pelotomaculum propionicicum TaxID=258475 RepID=UPI003B795774
MPRRYGHAAVLQAVRELKGPVMSKQSFIYGALVLLLAASFNRVLGFIYQVLMVRLILPEGLGLFAMVYPVYVLIIVLATAGIPVAIAKLVAEEMAKNNLTGAYRIFFTCFVSLILTSVLFSSLCYLCAPFLLAYVFPNPRVYYIFLSLLPGVIIVALCSALRGFFQGLQQMKPTAVSQSFEQLVRVISGLFLAGLLLPRGVEYAAVGASLGIIAGEFSGFLLMAVFYFKYRPLIPRDARRLPAERPGIMAARISSLAVPVTLTRFVSTLFLSLDAIIIPQRLQVCGLSLAGATAVYGQFVGIAQSLLFIPGIITISLATALVPAISDAISLKNIQLVRARCETAVRITLLAGIPFAVIFILLGDKLCGLIFGYPEAGDSLKILALGGPFLYLHQTTTGILHGMGRAALPFKNLVIASLLKISGIYYLTGMPHLGIQGAAAATAAACAVMAVLNLVDIRNLSGFKINYHQVILKPLTAAAAMSAVIFFSYNILHDQTAPESIVVMSSMAAGFLGYMLLLVINGGVNKKDLLIIKNM